MVGDFREAFLGFDVVDANEEARIIFVPCCQLIIALSKFLADHGDAGNVLRVELLENPMPVSRADRHVVIAVLGLDKRV